MNIFTSDTNAVWIHIFQADSFIVWNIKVLQDENVPIADAEDGIPESIPGTKNKQCA